ncbi:MAG: hypothetical protein ACUVSK_04225 [Desulfotomaculales bacterium]
MKVILKKAGVDPQPDALYLLQLVEWGLRNGVVSVVPFNPVRTGWEGPRPDPEEQDRRDFLELVERLYGLKRPERLMDLLLKNGPTNFPEDEPWVNPKVLAKLKSPEDAAQYLAESLQATLAADDPPDILRD